MVEDSNIFLSQCVYMPHKINAPYLFIDRSCTEWVSKGLKHHTYSAETFQNHHSASRKSITHLHKHYRIRVNNRHEDFRPLCTRAESFPRQGKMLGHRQLPWLSGCTCAFKDCSQQVTVQVCEDLLFERLLWIYRSLYRGGQLNHKPLERIDCDERQ